MGEFVGWAMPRRNIRCRVGVTNSSDAGGRTRKGFAVSNSHVRDTVTIENFQAVRDQTEHLAAPLSPEDQQIQSMADGGYHEARHWLSEGWATAVRDGWEAPLYWDATKRGWHVHTLHGLVPVDPAEPVCHISHFEADAFASWAGGRLPTEAELEHASAGIEIENGSHTHARRFRLSTPSRRHLS